MSETIVDRIRAAAGKRILLLPHALTQMVREERMITRSDVEAVVTRGELVENYPDDPRGPSCLLLGRGEDGAPLHLVCAPQEDYLAIITAYRPDPERWAEDSRRRLPCWNARCAKPP